ncbi:type II secretion system secretin GspD [Glaciimonas immobilis]|uniref:General secretion pathway protein D n=1 Tax=Glaciimonas immobilis TaxID=728004 RepID=A0A840RWG4_9BURK|nr:type II secretion system secretin GspD [Glaciimonas immobilis]KAF3996610.1 type II secretion system secretin GspD [Glaciimonas immobilis]MBB5201014.1 general secretion pathway protein D [Glaciimonas immobilis]
MKNTMHTMGPAIRSTFDIPSRRTAAVIALMTCVAITTTQPAMAAPGMAGGSGSGSTRETAISKGASKAVGGNSEQAAMNFVGADIVSVIKAVGQYTNTTFIIDPRVKGTVNLVSEKPLTKSDAFDLLASTLRLQGYVVVRGDGFAKVVPEADAKLQLAAGTNGVTGTNGPIRGDQMATRIFTLNYESAINILPVLRPLISPNNTINANPGNNTLIVTDYAENLQRLGKMIAAMDVPAVSDLDVIPIRYAVASDIAVMASKLLDSGSSAGGSDNGRIVILADSRTNSVILRAPSNGRANLAKSLIAKLDQPTAQVGNVHVVYLRNADAAKLARTLRNMVSQDTTAAPNATASTAATPPGGMLQTSTGGTAATSASGNSGSVGTSSQSSDGHSAGFIQADETTNTLIITASEPVYRNLRGVIDQLDTRRAQVYVEALIVEVTDKLSAQLGVQWLGLSGNSTSAYRVAGGTSFSSGGDNIINQALGLRTGGSVQTPGNGLTIGIFRQIAGKIGLGALAHALDGKDGSSVLSMPNLLTLDNEEAKIIVGQNVPFITGSYVPNSGGAAQNPFQTIERKDVGVALRVRPHISEGGTVRMEISQEVSSVDPASLNNSAGLTTNKRSLDTNVVMDDGEIIVLGGLIGDNKSSSVQKVPLLGDLPFIGNFFKYQSGARAKTNLMIFLRPTVVRNKEQSGTVVANRYDYIRQAQIEAEPEKSLLMDFGSAVVPAQDQGGPFMRLSAQGVPTLTLPPQSPQSPQPAPVVTSPEPVMDRTP